MGVIRLKKGREKSVMRRHPWIFSGAIATVEGTPQPGTTVDVVSFNDRWLARGAYSPRSQMRVRVWSFESQEHVTPQFFHQRLQQAINARQQMVDVYRVTAYRLVHAESDGLPGVVIDRYGDFLVCQFLTTGADCWKAVIVEQLRRLIAVEGIYERSDVDVRQKEGLPLTAGVLWGEEPPPLLEVKEGDVRFWVDAQHGHKTGFYLDQRENRAMLAEYVHQAEVLNCFAYTGGFGVVALKCGATHVTHIDSSADALEIAQKNAQLNNLDLARMTCIQDDVFHVLRRYRDKQRQFDCIVLDPPKFVESRKHLERACRGYKDINLLALQLLKPGGILFTFSCSGLMSSDLFQKVVADAALDARRDVQILRRLSQAADHPVSLNFPEGSYLKGLVCQVG
jgi:23S rRNA (cytosine1962-C5)-methyltransferase